MNPKFTAKNNAKIYFLDYILPIFLSFVTFLIIHPHIINILVSDFPIERREINQIVEKDIYPVIFILSIFHIFISAIRGGKIEKRSGSLNLILFYILLIGIFGSSHLRTTFPYFLVYSNFIAIYIVLLSANVSIYQKNIFLMSFYSITMAFIYILILVSYNNDTLWLRELFGFKFSPQIGSLLQSTEVSLVLGQAILIGASITAKYHYSKLYLIITNCINLAMLAYLFSVSSILYIYLCVLFLLKPGSGLKSNLKIISIVLILIFTAAIINYNLMIEILMFKLVFEEGGRLPLINALFDKILDGQLFGAGFNSVYETYGVYPHNNLIGALYEGGIFHAISYVFLTLLPIMVFLYKKIYLVEREYKGIFLLIVYFHYKGLFQDTWPSTAITFWTSYFIIIIFDVHIKQKLNKDYKII